MTIGKLLATTLTAIWLSTPALAWDGFDYDTGDYVEIERGNLVRPGKEIEFYDYGRGEYRYADVEDVRSYGGRVEVEVYDHDSGERRTFEMERR